MSHPSKEALYSRPAVLASCLEEIHQSYAGDGSGALADYIPELTKADANHFGMALATADGETYAVGDSRTEFTVQSISKAFVYGLALEDHGLDGVLAKVGVEPSGDAFNAIVFDETTNRPFNPMVNAGAIATTGLIRGHGVRERMDRIIEMFRRYTGRTLGVDEAVFASESATGHRNRAITWLMLNFGMVDARVDEHLEVYFRQCSLLVTAEDLAMMAATLANGGVNPVTGERALASRYVKHVTAVMASCGMYDFAGEWSFRVGLPAKSGVGGGIVAVLPGQMGIGTFSPLLDARGNSVRGIRACEELSRRFGLHVFDASRSSRTAVARNYRGDQVRSKVVRRAMEQTVLNAHAREVVVLEVQGDLQFGSAEQVVRQASSFVGQADGPCRHLIVDLRRVTRITRAAADLLARLGGSLADAGVRIYFSSAGEHLAVLTAAGLPPACCHETLDQALEHCEAALLAQSLDAGQDSGDVMPLAQMELLGGLDPGALEFVAARVSREHYVPGAAIIRSGDSASQLFFLASGRVAILIDGAGGHKIRVTTISPGVAFGEMALIDGRPRSADAVAEDHCVVFSLSLEALQSISGERPDIALAIMANMARILSGRLRESNGALHALSA